jgi:hypothetical protein
MTTGWIVRVIQVITFPGYHSSLSYGTHSVSGPVATELAAAKGHKLAVSFTTGTKVNKPVAAASPNLISVEMRQIFKLPVCQVH